MFEEDQEKEPRMKSSMVILSPRIMGDQNPPIIPRKFSRIVGNSITFERTREKKRRIRRRKRRRRNILNLIMRSKIDIPLL